MPHIPDPANEPTGLAGGPGPTPPGIDDGTLEGTPPSPAKEPVDPAAQAAREDAERAASHSFETEGDRARELGGGEGDPDSWPHGG